MYIFEKIIERYRNTINLHSIPISSSFKILATDPRVSDLNNFLKNTEFLPVNKAANPPTSFKRTNGYCVH